MSLDFIEQYSKETETIFKAEEFESSEDPSMSSLSFEVPEVNNKKILYSQGLYDPGSGEVCYKYIGISDSSLLQQLYYNYPAVTDPGIQDALFSPEKPITYHDDGQELYIATCKEMGQAPISKFYRDLLSAEINLAYYCVDPKGVRAIALALTDNSMVKILNLTDNFLTDDACYHLGEMLKINSTLEELNMSGCKIKSSGAQRLLRGLARNWSLKILNLDKNELGDDGAEHVAKAVAWSLHVEELYLSYNRIEARGASALAGALETRCKLIKLNLSWNNFTAPGPTYCLLTKLGESETIQEIDLSWNALAGPGIGIAIKLLMKAPNLRYLNLSNNALTGESVINLIGNLRQAHNLVTLDLSFNPLTPADALNVLLKIKSSAVHIQNLLLDNVYVNVEFLEVLKGIKGMKSKENFSLTYGRVIPSFKGLGPDMRELVLKRAEYLSKRSRKRHLDIALIAIVAQLIKDNVEVMAAKDFTAKIRSSGAPLDANLIDAIIEAFAAPSLSKIKMIDIKVLADYVKRRWPDRKLPPTPPTPEPEPKPKQKVKQKLNRKGKNKRKT